MNLEVLAWAPSVKEWEQAITTYIVPADGLPLASYAYDMDGVQILPPVLVPHAGLNIDEIGEIPAVYGPPPEGSDMGTVGDLIKPAVEGFHVNLRFHEPLAEALTEGISQVDEEGNPLPLFDRTNFLVLFPDAIWHQDESGVPGGYVGTKGLKLFDPAMVATRHRIWA